jgi:hypothetical protein
MKFPIDDLHYNSPPKFSNCSYQYNEIPNLHQSQMYFIYIGFDVFTAVVTNVAIL